MNNVRICPDCGKGTLYGANYTGDQWTEKCTKCDRVVVRQCRRKETLPISFPDRRVNMSPELHDMIHALARLEKYHDEQRRWIEIVNKLMNEIILKEKKDDPR